MNCPFLIKICTSCKTIYVANDKNFHKKKNGKYGLESICKICKKNKQIEYLDTHKEERKKYNKQYYKDNIESEKQRSKIKYQNNLLKNPNYNKELYQKNKQKNKIRNHKHYIDNINEYKEKHKTWRINNPDKVFNYHHNRRIKEQNQGDGLTKEQWLEMMNFFNWKCAYSQESFDDKIDNKKRTVDHIMPIDLQGLNEPWNCVPMCKGYNSSKHKSNMLEWYKQQEFYSEKRLNKIYEWQKYAYDKWNKKE